MFQSASIPLGQGVGGSPQLAVARQRLEQGAPDLQGACTRCGCLYEWSGAPERDCGTRCMLPPPLRVPAAHAAGADERSFGPDHPATMNSRYNYAEVLSDVDPQAG